MRKFGNLFDALKPVGKAVNEHKGTILTVVNIVATCYAVYRAYKDGPKFKKVLEECKEEELGFFDTAKKVAPIAAPTAAAVAVSGLSAVGMNREIGNLKGALDGMTSAYDIARIAKTEYEEKTKELVGEEKAQEIRDAVTKKRFDDDLAELNAGRKKIVNTGYGEDLFYDEWSGRFFYSDIAHVKQQILDLNYQLMSDMYISVNELYSYIGLPGIESGKSDGWDIEHGQIDVWYSAALDDCDRAYTVIRFKNEPRDKFSYQRRW